MPTKYMHTIDGRPATWSGYQIVFPATNSAVRLVNNLRTIRRQQLQTEEFRLTNKFDHDPSRYGYVRVRLTEESQ